jgi:putative redox protein
MVNIEVVYEGELRCTAVHEPSKSKITTDAPVDNHGKGEAFSPTDLVGTALGTCMMTIMGIQAKRHGINLNGSRVKVGKVMATAPLRKIARLEVAFTLPAAVAADHRKLLENAALTCPVHASLHPDVAVPIVFHWSL